MTNGWAPPPAVARDPEPVNETLEGFSDWHQIGRGGDALVYRAIQTSLQREVAIKVLTLDDEESVRRFTREVQLMVQLGRQHPNIAKVLQIGTSSLGRPCIVMDYYELGSLDQRLTRIGPLSADEVIRVGTVIADALAFAHANGVLHRDVKPQNILILPTSYVLADFGIARLIDSAHTSSSDRFSYRHASPQVLDGHPPSESDDVFSLGATMFHLLDGRPPFTTTSTEPDSALAYIKRVRISEPRPLTRPDLPPGLVELIRTCLNKDPAQRFRSAAEARDELAKLPSSWVGAPVLPSPHRPPAVQPAVGPNWGGAPGHVSDIKDLTSMRLRSADGPSSAVSAPDSSDSALSLSEGRTGGSRWSVVLGGIAVGIALVILGWSLWRPTGTFSALPATTPTPEPTQPTATAPPTTDAHNPNLAPRELKVTVTGDTARATWEKSLDEPDAYGWGVTGSASTTAPIDNRNLPSDRAAEVDLNPTWQEVCFTVVGVRSGKYGATQTCVPR